MDFSVHGPIHGGAKYFHTSLARLLWWALHPKQSLFDLPSGWIHGHVGKRVVIPSVADASRDAAKMIQSLLHGELVAFSEWVHDRTTSAIKESEAAFRVEDLEAISRVLKKLSHDSFRN